MNPEHVPVIVGVGQVNDRPGHWEDGLDSLGLMESALRVADADAGTGWLGDIELLTTVDQISCPEITEIASRLARSLGATAARVETTDMPHGDSPLRLLNEAANRVGGGELKLAAVVGGESLRTSAQRARASARSTKPGDILRASPKRLTSPYRKAFGLTAPTDMYPLYENACRASFGQTLQEGQAETGEIWSRLASVAAGNHGAWIRRDVSAGEIVTPSRYNRPIAHPYTKLMVANASINQGAGFLVTSLAEARRRGVPDRHLVYVGNGAAAEEPAEILDRESYHRSVSMQTVLRRALDFNGKEIGDISRVELYSCFPCVPKMARRVLHWPADRPVSVVGGLTFGGAPVANYMSHAVVRMVELLRNSSDAALLFANGGIVTTNHAIVLSGSIMPEVRFPRSFDVQSEADISRGPAPGVDPDYIGEATIETWTVFYDRDFVATNGVVVARTSDDKRTLALIPGNDRAGIAALTEGLVEPVGRRGQVVQNKYGRCFVF